MILFVCVLFRNDFICFWKCCYLFEFFLGMVLFVFENVVICVSFFLEMILFVCIFICF